MSEEKDRLNILSFGSLEDFAEGMKWEAENNVVRVEGVVRKEPNRAVGDHWVHYLVVITALMRDGNTAACLLEAGRLLGAFPTQSASPQPQPGLRPRSDQGLPGRPGIQRHLRLMPGAPR